MTEGSSLVVVLRLLIAVTSLVVGPGLYIAGTAIWHMGLGAPRHVGSSRARDQTHVPCAGRRTPSHWTTREVPNQP